MHFMRPPSPPLRPLPVYVHLTGQGSELLPSIGRCIPISHSDLYSPSFLKCYESRTLYTVKAVLYMCII